MELLQGVEMLAGADELDRHAGDRFDREGRPAAGVAIELRHDDAVQPQRFVERLGAVHGILPRHAVHDQIHLIGADLLFDPCQLLHQLCIDVQPAGRVEDDDRNLLVAGFFDRVLADEHRVRRSRLRVDLAAELLAEHLQLVNGGGALEVGRDEQRPAAALFDQPAQLAAGGRLAGALQPAEHQDRGAGFEMERMVHRPHQVDQLPMDDADDVLVRIERLEDLLADLPLPSRGR